MRVGIASKHDGSIGLWAGFRTDLEGLARTKTPQEAAHFLTTTNVEGRFQSILSGITLAASALWLGLARASLTAAEPTDEDAPDDALDAQVAS